MGNGIPVKKGRHGIVGKDGNTADSLSAHQPQSNQLAQDAGGSMLLADIQFIENAIELPTQIEHSHGMSHQGNTGVRYHIFFGEGDVGFSLSSNFTWTTFFGRFRLHPFDDLLFVGGLHLTY